MSGFARPSLIYSQPLAAKPAAQRPALLATLRLWRQRVRERRALAELSARELADFGATSADVYRELSTPFWRALPPC
ncbi:MAG TPA: DUF1127 domain-containing protein [Acetobacteraceae bacterium]|jgi:uncharacterized protein YjiS (DUF1127 family)